MFENVLLTPTESTLSKKNEIIKVVTDDEMWREFAKVKAEDLDKAIQTDKETGLTTIKDASALVGMINTTFDSMKDYVKNNEGLSNMMDTMRNALLGLVDGEESVETTQSLEPVMGQPIHDAICDINTLNGYQVDSAKNLPSPDLYSRAKEVTEKTPQTSLTQQVYAFMEHNHYADIQTDPRANMLIHLAHLSEKMMGKLPEMVKLSCVEKGDQILQLEIPAETHFFSRITNPDDLELLLDDKKLQEKIQENLNEIKKKQSSIDAYEKEIPPRHVKVYTKGQKAADEEAKRNAAKEIRSFANEQNPTYDQKIAEKQMERMKYYSYEHQTKVDQMMVKFEQDLIEDNKANIELNAMNEEYNQEVLENMKLVEQMTQERETKLSQYRQQKAEMEKLRAERNAAYEKAENDYYDQKNSLPDKISILEGQYGQYTHILEAMEYLTDMSHIPPQEHLQKVKDLDDRQKALDDMSDLMDSARNNKTLDLIKPGVNKDVGTKTKRVEELNSSMATIRKKLQNEKDAKKLNKLSDEHTKINEQYIREKDELENLKEAAAVQGKLDALWKQYPDMKTEYDQRMKNAKNTGENAYDIMHNMWDHTYKAYQAEYMKYSKYHKHAANLKNGSERLQQHNKTIADVQALRDEIKTSQETLDTLKKPDKEAYFKETDRLCDEIYSEKTAQEAKAYEEDSAERIQTQKEQYGELGEIKPILTEEEIKQQVAAKRSEEEAKKPDYVKNRLMTDNELKSFIHNTDMERMQDGVRGMRNKVAELKDANKSMINRRKTAMELHQKAKDAYDAQEGVKDKWNTLTKEPGRLNRFAQTMYQELSSLSNNILKGTKDGHTNTPEFNSMKDALDKAANFLSDPATQTKLNALDEKTVNDFKALMTNMDTQAKDYYDKKQKGIHWSPSNMRFIRLNMCKELQKTAAAMSGKLDAMQSLQEKYTALQNRCDTYKLEAPQKNYYQYVVGKVPGTTSKALYDRKEQEKKKQETVQQEATKQKTVQNSKAVGIGNS